MQNRNAFTLIELLVVIGIIGILATLTVPKIGSALEDAKEQQCRTNLRNLQAAVVSYTSDNGGALPRAQAYESFDSASRTYSDRQAWVSWVPLEGSDSARERALQTYWSDDKLKKESHSPQMADDLGTGEFARFAIENGALFPYVGDLKAYRCPVIEREMRKRVAKVGGSGGGDFDEEDQAIEKTEKGYKIYRTYAMNPYFGALSVGGGKDRWRPVQAGNVGTTHVYRDNGGDKKPRWDKDHWRVPEPSKLLLFTEIIPSYENNGAYTRKDFDDWARGPGALSKTACIDPTDPDSSKEEVICWDPDLPSGFDPSWEYGIHSSPVKGTHSALAVFYDGHIEKVFPLVPDTRENTAWYLNRGYSPGDPAAKQR